MSDALFDADDYDPRPAHQRGGSWTAARMAQQAALRAVEAAGDPEWATAALKAIHRTAERHARFISDDVWAQGLERTKDDRALGAAFKKARKLGWITPTGTVRPSIRSHLSGKPVWASLIFEGES